MKKEFILDDLNCGAKKAPVCLCLDVSSEMKLIWDDDLINAAKKIDDAHKNALSRSNGRVKLKELINNFYDELPSSVRKKYGKTKQDMLQKIESIDTGINQSRKVLKIFFETLRKKQQKDISVEVCVITFSGGKASVLLPFAGREKWDDEKWLREASSKFAQISYGDEKKSMFIGLEKAAEMLNERFKSYEKNVPAVRGRLVLLTRPTKSSESPGEKIKIKHVLDKDLLKFKIIPVLLGKNEEQVSGSIDGLKFPAGTKFFNASVEPDALEKIFEAISVSVSSNSPEIQL